MPLKSLLCLILVPILCTGCGGAGGSSGTDAAGASKLSASQTCMSQSCHAAQVSPTTGALIADEWRASTHNLQNGAGCADCHEPDAGHPDLCNKCHGGGGFAVTKNPDAAGKCYKCHGPSFPDNVLMALAPQHFGYSSAHLLPHATRASYVSGQYQGRCRACHNPHDNTLTRQHRDYAKSLHGDPKAVAWSSRDFKQSADCIRCHTSTGFINFVSSGFTAPTTGFGAGDATREVLACDACHTSYDFKNSVRKVPAFVAGYKNFNGTAQALFPDSGESNLCIPCHSGRESGQSIEAIADFSKADFVNSHYLAAAGLMYMQVGFINFTSPGAVIGASTYGKSLAPDSASTPGGLVDGVTSTHRKFGTALINNDSHKPGFFVAGVFDRNGPCVTCHLNAGGVPPRPGSGHTLKIDANAYRQVCINCHTSENAVAMNPDGSDFQSIFLEPQSESFQSSLKLLQQLLLSNYRISFDQGAYPYFYDENLPLWGGKKQAVKDWTRGGTVNGRKLTGACFNLNLLTRDPAAYAHARTYSRRLVYDSIDFLDDGKMNLSAGATAAALSQQGTALTNSVFGLFARGAKAYKSDGIAVVNASTGAVTYGITQPDDGTSEAMLFLLGWNRGKSTIAATGAWTVPERP